MTAGGVDRRGRLFWKYVIFFVVLVSGALLTSGALEIYFSYQENKAALVLLEREKAVAAAERIEQFVKEIERQIGWTTHPQLVTGAAALEQRRIDFYRLWRQVPAVMEVSLLDAAGKEELSVSRLKMEVTGSRIDYSKDPKFTVAKGGKTYFSPVYFRKESEPYITVAMATTSGPLTVTVAEVNLKFIWDVVSQIKIGKAGHAYVIDSRGRLIAHPDISLVLKKSDFSTFPQVQAARAAEGAGGQVAEPVTIAQDLQGRQVLTAFAPISTLGWLVFVEQPLVEAFQGIRASIVRAAVLILVGVALSILASLVLARRMVKPIQALQAGAARIGAGELGHRIDVETGDELETLADQFNRTAAQLEESYANLEQKVEARTRELSEALEQQTATGEILRVISSSPTDIQPVMDAVARSAACLCRAEDVLIQRVDGDVLRVVARFGDIVPKANRTLTVSPDFVAGQAVLERKTIHVHDMRDQLVRADYPGSADLQARQGFRTVLVTPLVREGAAIGTIVMRRLEVRPFTDKQIALLKTFADQAVIAIENVRLFNELAEKNSALTEALEQQTATGEILRVLSGSPTSTQPVFDAIAASAQPLCEADFSGVLRYDGEVADVIALTGFDAHGVAALRSAFPSRPVGLLAAALEERVVVHTPDAANDPRSRLPHVTAAAGGGAWLFVPMLREGTAIGAVIVARREPRAFTDKQIALLKTFADQAVIAIENVRLFNELEEKNSALTEALEQQTATSEILRVISSSPTELQPVMDGVAESAARVCGANDAHIYRVEGDVARRVAHWGTLPAMPPGDSRPLLRESLVGRAILDGQTIHIPDVVPFLETEYPRSKSTAGASGTRTILVTPLLREGVPIGAILIRRFEVRPFTDKQIALLKTFADQAVIAIENVRLFNELEERTRALARSVEELQVLGEVGRAVGSTLDLETVLATIIRRANQLSGTDFGVIYEYDEASEQFRLRATENLDDDLVELLHSTPLGRGEGAIGRAAETREPVQIPDILEAGAYQSRVREALVRTGHRALLAIPLLREEAIIGGLVVARKAPGAFAPEPVELLKTFATQSVLAIQNARLYRELEEKSRQLEVANRHKSEFLANMSHELRTPLNAVIGFSEVLLERMFGEVNDKQAEYLQDILSSGRHLLSLINDILDLSKIEAGRMELELTSFELPVALDNALTLVRERASRHGIALGVKVDERLGTFVGDERKIKQVLVNLLSNAVKFTPEGGRVEVAAARVNGSVEISVSDTGIGIAAEDQEAIFEEFRQAGRDYARKREGTGLGLTLVRRFVELHGGRIWVKSEVGKGSTFTVSLPERPWPAS